MRLFTHGTKNDLILYVNNITPLSYNGDYQNQHLLPMALDKRQHIDRLYLTPPVLRPSIRVRKNSQKNKYTGTQKKKKRHLLFSFRSILSTVTRPNMKPISFKGGVCCVWQPLVATWHIAPTVYSRVEAVHSGSWTNRKLSNASFHWVLWSLQCIFFPA